MVKILTSTRALIEEKGKAKLCITCDSVATTEALFNIDSLSVVLSERYCDLCLEKIK